MKTLVTKTMLGLALAGASASHAATLSLVDNTNPGQVTGEGQGPEDPRSDYVSQILAGQTLYIGIPYSAGAWPSTEATDYFEISTFLLGVGGSSSVSFSFYSAEDTGTELSAITQLTEIEGFTPGTVNISEAGSGTPMELGPTAGVTAQIQYADLTGNPFASISNGIVWLGITNTGSNDVAYYTGDPFGLGQPAPAYEFGGPFDTGATALHANTYTYNSGGDLAAANQNVHPYVTITAETIPVPEPRAAALAGLAGVLLLLRRRI